MRAWRPKLKAVIALLLVWQLGTGLLLAGPAMASVHAGMATSTSTSHCHSHGNDGAPQSAPTSGNPAHSHHSGSDDCCLAMGSCSCVCVQGAAAMPPMLSTTEVLTDRTASTDLRSPPLLRRTAQVFRPPI